MLFLHWLVVFAGLSGLGSLCQPEDRRAPYRIFDAFWVGVFLASGLLQGVHLWLPVRPAFALALILFGIAGGLAKNPSFYALRFQTSTLVMLSVFALWATMASLHQPPQFDFGLYHLPTVRWAQAYAAVPGLANLYWALGQSSSFFVLTAAFDNSRMTWVQSYHIMGGLFVLALAFEGCVALARLRETSQFTHSDVFRAFGLVVAATLVGNWLPTLSPDVAVSVVGYVAASRLAALLLDRPPASTMGATRALLCLAGLGMTLKLTSAVYFAIVAIVSLVSIPAALRTLRNLAPIVALIAASGGVWCASSALLSGYPFYPAMFLSFRTAWAVPEAIVRGHAIATLWHTRGAGVPMNHWVPHWLKDVVWTAGKFQVVVPLGLGAIALTAMVTRGRIQFRREAILFMMPAIVGGLVWALAAPEPRFAGAIFWHLGIAVIVLTLSDAAILGAATARAVTASAVTFLIALYLVAGTRSLSALPPWAHASVPSLPQLTRVTTKMGLVVYKPSDGQCLDAPLPCSPDPEPTLALRRSGDLGSGFVNAGPLTSSESKARFD